MMKENYNNKTKLRSAWFALVLLMITALPISALNKGDRFKGQGGIFWYEVVDATKHTVKVTYENPKATTQEARDQKVGRDYEDKSNKEYKGYYGKLNDVITIPETVKDADGTQWTVVAIGTCAFINERGFFKLPAGKENAKPKDRIPGTINITVNLPSTIEHIEEAAFYQAYACTINFPEGLKTIGRQAFYKAVVGYYYRYNYAHVRKGANAVKTNTPQVLGQTAIGPQAFEECSTNGATLICNKISYLGYQAFKKSGLIIKEVPLSVKLGEQPTDPEIIAMYANLPGVDMESGAEAFSQYNKGVVTLKEGITTIPKGMFDNAFQSKPIDKFVIPSTVTSIEERAFANAGIKSFSVF